MSELWTVAEATNPRPFTMAAMAGRVEGIVAKDDEYGGIVVEILNLPSTERFTVVNSLRHSLECWRRQEKKVVWLKLPSEDANAFLLPAIQEGFVHYRTDPTSVMLVLRLGDHPANASNQADVGSFVYNAEQEIDTEPYISLQRQYSNGVTTIGNSARQSNPISHPLPNSEAFTFPPSVQTNPLMVQTQLGWAPQVHGNCLATERRCSEGSEILELVPQTQKKRSHTPEESARKESGKKGTRGPNFTNEEKHFLLAEKLQWYLNGKMKGKPGESWSKPVSQLLLEKHGFDRSSTSWQQQWDTLLKHKNAIDAHESEIQSGRSVCGSFWKLNDDERRNLKLPRVFYSEWYEFMKKIRQVEGNPTIKETQRSVQVDRAICQSSYTLTASTITDPATFSGEPSHANRPLSSSHEIRVSTVPLRALFSDDFSRTDQGSQQPEGEKLNMPEDDLITRISAIVQKQFEETVIPLISDLRSRKEDKKKHQDKILAVEEAKLDLMRREQQLKYSAPARRNAPGNNYAGSSGAQFVGGDSNMETTLDHEQLGNIFFPDTDFPMWQDGTNYQE